MKFKYKIIEEKNGIEIRRFTVYAHRHFFFIPYWSKIGVFYSKKEADASVERQKTYQKATDYKFIAEYLS